jgi:hypothetical protein
LVAHDIVEILIQADGPVSARRLVEVSVHLPNRGTRWIASFRDGTGRQVWRTTRMRDRSAALALGQRWEQEAKRKRAAQGAAPRKPTIRVRPGSAEHEAGLLSQAEVAAFLHISERAVREIERRAFDKLRRHPGLRDFWRQWLVGEVEEAASQALADWVLSRAEINAVCALAQTPAERQALRKLLALTGCERVSTSASGTDAESM